RPTEPKTEAGGSSSRRRVPTSEAPSLPARDELAFRYCRSDHHLWEVLAACSMRLGSFTTNEPPTATCERRPFGSNSHGWIAPGIDAGWRMVQPFLDAWRGATATLLNQLIQGNRSSGCPKPQPLSSPP